MTKLIKCIIFIWLYKCKFCMVIGITSIRQKKPIRAPGLYSPNGKTSYRQISWSLEAVKLGVIMIVSHWNLAGTSATPLPKCLSNFTERLKKIKPGSRGLRDFARSCGKSSVRLVNRGNELIILIEINMWPYFMRYSYGYITRVSCQKGPIGHA